MTERALRTPALVSLVLALGLALAVASPAPAHSGAPASSPAAGAVVASLPATVTITFDGRLARVIGVKVIDAKGSNHAASARLDPRNAMRVLVRTARPVPGAYTVRWQVRSEDGHAQSGTFSFRARR
jgi:methionine-rich copper-binding protein CopC